MGKVQIIENLFFNIVTYSYLIIPLGFLFFSNKKKEFIPILLALYGLIFFGLLLFYYDIPKSIKKEYQSFYTFFEYAVFATILWINTNQKKIKLLILIFSFFFFVFQLIYVFNQKARRLDSVPIGIETILLLIYILYFFYQFSKDLSTTYIYNHYAFWIAVGILIYLGGSFFFFILIDQLTPDEVEVFGNMTYVAEIIKNILFATSLYIYSKQSLKKIAEKQVSVPFLDHI